MTLFLIYILSLILASAGFYLFARLLSVLDPRILQWPAIWAVSLIFCVVIPFLGIFASVLPNHAVGVPIESISLHGALDILELIETSDVAQAQSNYLSWENFITGLMILYMTGLFLRLFRLYWGRHRIRRIVKSASVFRIKADEHILISSKIHSPFAYSPIGPSARSYIVLPESFKMDISAEQIEFVLKHERAHIARRDDQTGLILRIILCLCWISPFAHGLFKHWSQSTELRCDMAVTAKCNFEMRRHYAETLVTALHIMAGRVRQYPAAAFSTHRIRNEKMRIKHIMAGTQPSYKRRRDSVYLSLIVTPIAMIGMISTASISMADPSRETHPRNWVSSDMVTGKLTSKFGPAADPFTEGKVRNHYGIDIAASIGTPIYAPMDGVVLSATDLYDGKPNYGKVVVFQSENGVVTLFSHLNAYQVKAGQVLQKGEQLAEIGNSGKSTGPHVHIETYQDGKRVDPQRVWNIKPKT